MYKSMMPSLRALLLFCSVFVLASADLEQRAVCNPDNCLRALRATSRLVDSNAFCSRYISQTTPTVTVTTTAIATRPAPTISTTATISTTTTSIIVSQQTTLVVSTVQGGGVTTVVTISKRVPAPSPVVVPQYLSACSSSSARLSSACSCYIGTVAAPTTTTVTRTNTVGPFSTSTKQATSTVVVIEKSTSTSVTTASTTTTISGPVSTETALRCIPGGAGGCVYLRIEGLSNTIFEDFIVSGPRDITTPSGGTHACTGTNGGANPVPGATCTSALDEASKQEGFPYDGTYSANFQDFFITSIGDTTQTSTQFFGLLNNYAFTPTGGCQSETTGGDSVLWAFDAFNVASFLHLSVVDGPITYPDVAGIPVTVPAGTVNLYVRGVDGNGGGGSPAAGASVGTGGLSDAGGKIVLTLAPGRYTFKASKSSTIRSNRVILIVV